MLEMQILWVVVKVVFIWKKEVVIAFNVFRMCAFIEHFHKSRIHFHYVI